VATLDEKTTERLTNGPYLANALDVDQDQTLTQVERSMPVRLIATRENLITATPDEIGADVLEKKMKPCDFDYLPVRRSTTGPMIGIISASAIRDKGHDRNISDLYEPLGPDDLISAEASLLHFVWSADQQPRRLVLEGKDIRGIVTLSDIQKLPVRISLFSLFIHFELLLTEHLRHSLRNKIALEFVSPARRDVISEKWRRFTDSRLEQDIFSAMDICDKRDVAEKLKILGKSGRSISSSISYIENFLRNPIAHGADYAISQEAAHKTVRAAQATRDWISDLRNAALGRSIKKDE
jgi:hypothetical protein